MRKKVFTKISVGDIVAECGLSRQAFYYHFKDKYDLLNWIYYTETVSFMFKYDTIDNWADGLKNLCCYMKKNHVFYINALNTTGQDSFPMYLHKYIYNFSIKVVENIFTENFNRDNWDYTIDFFSTAFVSHIVKWANNGMKENPEEYIVQMRAIFDGSRFHELNNESPSNSVDFKSIC
ncbi:MAG: TetR/AcrR family transcriptional regulator [Mobilitalea sp.]